MSEWLRSAWLSAGVKPFISNKYSCDSAKSIGLPLVHQGNVYEHKDPHCLRSAGHPRHPKYL